MKSLLLLPERYRIAVVDRLGLVVRAVAVWDKPNPMPESVADRVARKHEDWVHITRSPRYYASVDEIREPHRMRPQRRPHGRPRDTTLGQGTVRQGWPTAARDEPGPDGHELGKLPGSVWRIPTQPLKLPPNLRHIEHRAAFPMEWPRRLISGWCPREVSTACGQGRRVLVAAQRTRGGEPISGAIYPHGVGRLAAGAGRAHTEHTARTVVGYACACPDIRAPARPGVVLDPVSGTGTTALVAVMLGRVGVGVDLGSDYAEAATWRASDPKERARAAGRTPDEVATLGREVPGQMSVLDLVEGAW